jgi:hypothetical protein
MRIHTIVRSSAVVGGIGTLAVVVGGLGIATAANGGSLVLGGSNSAKHTTTLTDSKGTPLSLKAKANKPALTVNTKALVKNLNSSELGGLTAGQLSTGSSAQFKVNIFDMNSKVIALTPSSGSESFTPTTVLSTKALAAGTYLTTATALTVDAICYVSTTSLGDNQQWMLSGVSGGSESGSAATTQAVKVSKGKKISLYCDGTQSSAPGGEVIDAGLTAIRVASATTGTVRTPTLATPLLRK